MKRYLTVNKILLALVAAAVAVSLLVIAGRWRVESENKTYDVILRVKPEKVSQIKSQTIDGRKSLVIPMEENEHAAVNGVNTTV